MECESELSIFEREVRLHCQQENQYVKLHRRVKLMAMESYVSFIYFELGVFFNKLNKLKIISLLCFHKLSQNAVFFYEGICRCWRQEFHNFDLTLLSCQYEGHMRWKLMILQYALKTVYQYQLYQYIKPQIVALRVNSIFWTLKRRPGHF